MRVGLTGATGFLGSQLIESLLIRGHEVVAWRGRREVDRNASDRITWIDGRLGDHQAAIRLASQCDAIVHAGVSRTGESFMDDPADPIAYFQTNVMGSLELIEAAAAKRLKRFVFVSSGSVHERVATNRTLDEMHPLWPASIYGAYKAAVEATIHAYGFSDKLACCSLRPTAIYGVCDPIEQSKWYGLIRKVVAGESVQVSGGGKSVHVADVADAIALLLETDQDIRGQTYNCTDGFISHREVGEIAIRLSGSKSALIGTAKQAANQIDTTKLQQLGFAFGGASLLHRTIEALIERIRRDPSAVNRIAT